MAKLQTGTPHAELTPISGGARAQFSQLTKLLKTREGENHLVIIQGAPDPDAISAALALEYINSTFGIETTILTFQHVSHTENRAMVKRLSIDLTRYDEGFELDRFSAYSIVDSQKPYTPIDLKLQDCGVEFLAFIDHHREDTAPPPAQFVDIRQNYASAATILCEYLKELQPKGLESGDPNQVRLATALMHGLRVDTQRFVLATRYEYEAASFIAGAVDHQVIEIIERKVITSSMMDMLENALVNRHVHDNFIFSDVGYVRAVDRDGIPQAAELLLHREGTDTVLVFGIVDEKFIDGSLRTRSETINPDEFLKGFLGISPESGRYYGGGNVRDRGGFQIPLGFFSLHSDKEQVYSIAKEVLERSFLDYIGKNEKKSSPA
jgi:nanoRNase/pAp phosphatase (c-di-AMP/oligoRNAs hydrolase)